MYTSEIFELITELMSMKLKTHYLNMRTPLLKK